MHIVCAVQRTEQNHGVGLTHGLGLQMFGERFSRRKLTLRLNAVSRPHISKSASHPMQTRGVR